MATPEEINSQKGKLTEKDSKKASNNWLEQFLAENPEVQAEMDREETSRKQQLSALQNQFDFIYNQEKKLKEIMGDQYNLDGSRNAQIQTMSEISGQMNNIVKGVGEKPALPPGTISLGEGEERIDISEDEFNQMINDPTFMQEKVQEYSQLPGGERIVDHLAGLVGQDVLNNGLQPATDGLTNNVPQPRAITPVPAQQVGGVDALKSTIKSFLSNISGGGQAQAAEETVDKVSSQAKSATRKGIV